MNKKIIFNLFFVTLIFGNVNFTFAEELKCDGYEKKVLKQEEYDKVLEICRLENEKENLILKEKEGNTRGVASEISKLNRQNKISQNYINAKTIKIKKLRRNIGENRADVKNLNEDILKLKKSLTKLVYKKYQYQDYSIVEAIFSKQTISEFFQMLELIEFLEKRISQNVKDFAVRKKDLEHMLGELEERNELEKELIGEKQEEKKKILSRKKYQSELLAVYKKEVGVQQIKVDNITKITQTILRKKFTVASGAKVTFGEAYNIINPYKKILGMDPAFVLAILFQESGHKGKIGGNIGRCTYQQKNPCGTNQVMRKSQQVPFEKIMTGLKLTAKNQKISCPICKDGSYGGAMGPAQFMPAT